MLNSILQEFEEEFEEGKEFFNVEGLHSVASKAFFITRLHKALSKPVMIITSGQDETERLLSE